MRGIHQLHIKLRFCSFYATFNDISRETTSIMESVSNIQITNLILIPVSQSSAHQMIVHDVCAYKLITIFQHRWTFIFYFVQIKNSIQLLNLEPFFHLTQPGNRNSSTFVPQVKLFKYAGKL